MEKRFKLGWLIYLKKTILILIVIISISALAGCKDNSLSEKAIEQGKLAMAEMEYTKALASFELAIDEGSEDEEVRELIEIIEKFDESKKLVDKGDNEDAEKLLNSINEDYKQYSIETDIETLKEEITYVKKNDVAIKEKIDDIDKLLSEKKYEDAKVEIEEILNDDTLVSNSRKEELNDKLQIVNDELSKVAIEKKEKEDIEAKNKEAENAKKEKEKNEKINKEKMTNTEFTWEGAVNIIKKVIGEEDSTFIYNGRTDVHMDDNGRRYYTIWKEDPNAPSTAEGTIATYNVFEDGVVTPY